MSNPEDSIPPAAADRPTATRSRRALDLTCTLGAAVLLACAPAFGANRVAGSLSPEQALAAFQIEPGLKIELVVAEPLVVDPVAFAFDEKLRLHVVENRAYLRQDPSAAR